MAGLLAGWVVMTPVYASAPQSAGFDGVACPAPVPEAFLLFAGGVDDWSNGAFVGDDAPLVFYVDPAVWPAFEASLGLEEPDLATARGGLGVVGSSAAFPAEARSGLTGRRLDEVRAGEWTSCRQHG